MSVNPQGGAVETSQPKLVVRDTFSPEVVSGASLSSLSSVNEIKVRSNKNYYSPITKQDLPNNFYILDGDNKQLFRAQEESDQVCRCLFGRTRAYSLRVIDSSDVTLLTITHDYGIGSTMGCCPWGMLGHHAVITDEQEQVLGKLVQQLELGFPAFSIEDENGEALYTIISKKLGCILPSFCFCLRGDAFIIYKSDSNSEIGYIGVEENDDVAYLKVPEDASAKDRALLLGALTFLNILFLTSNVGCDVAK